MNSSFLSRLLLKAAAPLIVPSASWARSRLAPSALCSAGCLQLRIPLSTTGLNRAPDFILLCASQLCCLSKTPKAFAPRCPSWLLPSCPIEATPHCGSTLLPIVATPHRGSSLLPIEATPRRGSSPVAPSWRPLLSYPSRPASSYHIYSDDTQIFSSKQFFWKCCKHFSYSLAADVYINFNNPCTSPA